MPHPSYIGRSLAVLNSAMLSRRGTRLGLPSSLGEKSKATKLQTSGPPTLPGVSSCPTTERARHSKWPAGALRFCAPSAHSPPPKRPSVSANPVVSRWPARAKVRGRRQHDSFGASSLFCVRIFPGVLEILAFAILLITHMQLKLPAF